MGWQSQRSPFRDEKTRKIAVLTLCIVDYVGVATGSICLILIVDRRLNDPA